jgi:hypothetical protein
MPHRDALIIDHPLDAALIEQLAAAGVRQRRMSRGEHQQCERDWRRIYGDIFRPGLRCREGAKAVHAFLTEAPGEWLLVPFLADVRGTPMHVGPPRLSAFACAGPLLEPAGLGDVEHFIAPPDFAWTLVRTHEDFELGGPYFVRSEWLVMKGCID